MEILKALLIDKFGRLGMLFYYLLAFAVVIVILLPISFLDVPFWACWLLTMLAIIPCVGNITQLVLWCITLPTVIKEPFSAIVLFYYIGLAIFVIFSVFPAISSIINAFRNR